MSIGLDSKIIVKDKGCDLSGTIVTKWNYKKKCLFLGNQPFRCFFL